MRLGGGAEGGSALVVGEQVLQRGPQRSDTPLLEGHAFAGEHVGTLGDVARHAAAAVGHGLQQAHGHALHVGRQHVGIAVGVQLLQGPAADEAGEEDAGVALGRLAQGRLVPGGVGAAAGDDEPLVRIETPEGLDQELGALLGDEPAQVQQVGALVEPPPLPYLVDRPRLLRLDTVGDERRRTAVGVLEVGLGRFGQDDKAVGLSSRGPLPHLDVGAGELAPLGALPVQAVDGGDGPDAGSLRQGKRHAGALGVVVDHVGPVLDGRQGGEVRGAQRGEPLLVDRPHGDDAHAVDRALAAVRGVAGHDIRAGAVVACDLVTERRHAAGELGHDDLHAALTGAVPLVSDHRDAHLARTLAGDDLDHREDDDLEVGDWSALGDVLQVAADHAVEAGGVALRDLPPAGDAGLHCQALQVELGVLRDLVGQRRARADDGHLAQEHVHELRELVDGVLADELADLRDARVVPHLEHGAGDLVLPLELRQALVGILVHAAELPHAEGGKAAVAMGLAHADLAVERVALALQADGRGQYQARDGDDGQHAAAEHDIERALYGSVAQARAVPVLYGLHGFVTADNITPVHGLRNQGCSRRCSACIFCFNCIYFFQTYVPNPGILPVPKFRLLSGDPPMQISHHTLLGRKHCNANAGGYASAAQIDFQISRVFASVNGFDKAFVAQQRTCRHYDLVAVF